MTKPQWLPENSISGCKQLIQEYWIRENAMKQIDIDSNNNYTSQDDYHYPTNSDYSKYVKSQPSYNFHVQSSTVSHVESCDQSSLYSHSESFSRSSLKSRSQFCNESDDATSSQHSDNQILQKVNKSKQ